MDNKVPRSVSYADFLVSVAGLVHNIAESFSVFTEELMEISIYHANRETKIGKALEEFTKDLETIQEDTDGT